eukprot:COSAG02_NODE_4384_length_5422_cov_23.616757_3_plen_112_part_00
MQWGRGAPSLHARWPPRWRVAVSSCAVYDTYTRALKIALSSITQRYQDAAAPRHAALRGFAGEGVAAALLGGAARHGERAAAAGPGAAAGAEGASGRPAEKDVSDAFQPFS